MDNENIPSRREENYERRSSRSARSRRSPWVFRLAAWGALILLFVAAGYYSTGLLFRLLSSRLESTAPHADVVYNSQQLREMLEGRGSQSLASVGPQRNVEVYVMTQDGTGLIRESRGLISDTQEADAAHALKLLLSSTPASWARNLEVRHLFRDGVTAYLDMPQAFLHGLETLEETQALMFITSIVRTMVENFQPVSRIYFLVEGRWVDRVGEIPLSAPWELPQS